MGDWGNIRPAAAQGFIPWDMAAAAGDGCQRGFGHWSSSRERR